MEQYRCIDDVFDFAIAREVEAHYIYVESAGWAEPLDVSKAFEGFSVDELGHKTRPEAIKARRLAFEEDEIGNLGITDRIGAAEPKANLSYREAQIVGMQREKDTFRLYTCLVSIAHEPGIKNVLSKLTLEEAGHKLRLEIE